MLLLVVTLMLALFMAIGAMLLTTAIRARTSVRAFAQSTLPTSRNPILLGEALDESLLTVLRGGTATAGGRRGWVITGTSTPNAAWPHDAWRTGTTSESILYVEYGDPLSGTGSIVSGSGSAVLTLYVSLPSASSPQSLGGRLLTVRPSRLEDGDITTFRILGFNSGTCYLANPPSPTVRRLPIPGREFDVVINGREFTPEAYDAYDDANMWLAQPIISGSGSSGPSGDVIDFNRLSFTGAIPETADGTVDNDLDGVPDGVWIPQTITTGSATPLFVIPDRPSPLGGTIRFQVSYLVLDLDGRINVNACGVATKSPVSYTGSPDVPLGMGYGPADVDASLLFTGSLPASSGLSGFTSSGSAPYWRPLLSGTGMIPNDLPVATGSASPTGGQRASPPQVGPIVGRYLADGRPGYDDSARGYVESYPTLSISGPVTSASYAMMAAGTNAFADLQGYNRVFMIPSALPTQITPTLTFFGVSGATSLLTAAAADATDNPYQSKLTGAPSGNDQPFTLGELERVLRPFDPDSTTLPPRLAAGLSNQAQRLRTAITTESWDTPALTGSAAQVISSAIGAMPVTYSAAAWKSSANKSNSISPDIAAGLRFNINRPLASPSDKYEFCKDLYSLVRLLGETDAKKAAQWAVNVLEFRDDDSLLTGFEYDSTIGDGWDVDGDLSTPEPGRGVVWGVERPEMIITETLAYGDQMWVVLHRPWNAQMRLGSATLPVEVIDPLLAVSPNRLSLKGWRLRFNNDTSVPLPPTEAIGVNDTVAVGTSAAGSLRLLTASLSSTGVTKAFLERLADPTKPAEEANGTNPYVAVDELVVTVWPDAASANRNVRGGTGSYWKTTSASVKGSTPMAPTGPADWFHWPNRPFISNVELTLVPSGSPADPKQSGSDMLANFTIPTNSLVNAPPYGPLLLEATYVPSRFAGTAIAAGPPNSATNTLMLLGLTNLHHMTTWREPGKVNVNAMVSGTDTAIGVDDMVWTTHIGGTSANPFAGTKAIPPRPARSISELVSLDPDNPATIKREQFPSTSPRGQNPFFSYSLASRLSNTATVRSNVFAIWITVRVTDDSPNAPPPMTKRMFAIVDRSIPVGYSPGENLNISDCIVLKRYLD